jgi:hypothetical protein
LEGGHEHFSLTYAIAEDGVGIPTFFVDFVVVTGFGEEAGFFGGEVYTQTTSYAAIEHIFSPGVVSLLDASEAGTHEIIHVDGCKVRVTRVLDGSY